MSTSSLIDNLVHSLGKFPGVGPKSAERIAYWLLEKPTSMTEEITQAMVDAKLNITYCQTCGNFAEDVICPICANSSRDHNLICVVEHAKDISALERTGSYQGVYHVLQGSLSPINGIGPAELNIKQLLERLKRTDASELIFALDPNVEGEATVNYISTLLEDSTIKMSKLGLGLPTGGDLEFADEITLRNALSNRREIEAGR